MGHGANVRIKRAGVLLFHPEPERFIPGAYVKVGYFRSESELAYHDEVRGSLFTQLRGTMDLLRTKYTRGLVSFRGIQRIETHPVPEAALREAVINALVHRDYAATGATLMRVYEDRIRITNSAVLPEGWTADTLLGPHASHAPNSSVADVFFRAGMI